MADDRAAAPTPLCDIAEGCAARFHESSLDGESRDLLRALGLTPASVVKVCKAGEPCIVQVRATRIGISQSVAGKILVIPQTADNG